MVFIQFWVHLVPSGLLRSFPLTRRKTGARCRPPGKHVAQRRGSSEGPDRGAARAAGGTGAAPSAGCQANHQNSRVHNCHTVSQRFVFGGWL